MTGAPAGPWYARLLGGAVRQGERLLIGGTPFLLRDGILRQERVVSLEQGRTAESFGFKWARRESYESPTMQADTLAWLRERYLGGDPGRLEELLPAGAGLLDAGCGAGLSALLLVGERLREVSYIGADISAAVDVARERFRERGLPGEFLQADLMELPFSGPTFDVVFSEGVLHHTDDTRRALERLAALLLPGGRLLCYVYARKGPVREFTDDLIREHLQPLTDEEAWAALRPLTRLGQALGELNLVVDVPEAIPFLGIPAGSIDLQRLFYWHFFKAYYRPGWSLEEMNHVNFDWYRPPNCHRQTPEQLREWCAAAGLAIERLDIQPSGLTVVARRDPR